jgi:acyl-CoA synthetase (AMP-forming)/AMP-acid ligase II
VTPPVRTLPELVAFAAETYGEREAYVQPATATTTRRSVTFAALADLVVDRATALAELGVTRGDVVALVMASSIEYATTYLAAAFLGAVTTGINPRLGAVQQRDLLERVAPTVVVVDPDITVEAPCLVRVSAQLQPTGPHRVDAVHVAEDEPVAIVWTSGTTARPKGALFTTACLDAVSNGVDVLGATGDRRLSPLPFAHVGYMTRVASELLLGITTVITPTPWSAADAVQILSTERITVAQGVPTQWALVLAQPSLATADLSSLRVAGTGAAKMPASRVEALRAALGVPVVVRYTSTESSLGCGTTPGDPDLVVARTVGKPVAGVERVVVGDDGAPCPPGIVGQVWLRSRASMVGYIDVAERVDGRTVIHLDHVLTASAKDGDGWIHTSDLGRVDEEGNLELVGRLQELYQRGGYNVYPAEVEEALRTIDSIADACVLGVDDDVLGEVGVACLVVAAGAAAPSLAEIRLALAPLIADYKRPDALVVVDALPLTAMSKVDRAALAPIARAAADRRRA